MSLIWSPEKAPQTSNQIRTPTKATTTMTLRSSPRKRLLIPENSSPKTPEKPSSPRHAAGTVCTPKQWQPTTKRLRFDDKPIAQTNDKIPLATIMMGLSNEQLMNIIQGLVTEQPQLEQQIRSKLPAADMRPLEEQLSIAKKNIFKSLPTSRLIKKTDSSSFSRAAIHLTAFKKTVVDQSKILHDSHHWDTLLDYTAMAWTYVKATPLWDNHSNNAVRRQCFKVLAWHSSEALKYGGVTLGEHRLQDFSVRINQMALDYEDITACSSTLNKLIMSLHQQQQHPFN